MNYYERHLGDYARDTAHLSLLEHGVYTLLLDRYYATEAGIPADQAHRVARARTDEERAAVDVVLSEFFTLTDGVWKQGRVEGEIEKANARINAARENGRRGGRPKGNRTETQLDTQQEPTGFSVGSQIETQSKALQTPDSIHQARNEASASAPRDAHTRAPVVDMAISLNTAGFRCTPRNPDLLAYADEGGDVAHLLSVASDPACAGKAAGYVLKFARRELAAKPSEVVVTQGTALVVGDARAGPAAPSKRMQAIGAIEEVIRAAGG